MTSPAAGKGRRPQEGAKPVSALDAAASVLATLTSKEAAVGLNTGEMIDRMRRARLWSSPAGKTPAATLYSALLREINTKGSAARFRRVGKGHFALTAGRGRPASRPAAKARAEATV